MALGGEVLQERVQVLVVRVQAHQFLATDLGLGELALLLVEVHQGQERRLMGVVHLADELIGVNGLVEHPRGPELLGQLGEDLDVRAVFLQEVLAGGDVLHGVLGQGELGDGGAAAQPSLELGPGALFVELPLLQLGGPQHAARAALLRVLLQYIEQQDDGVVEIVRRHRLLGAAIMFLKRHRLEPLKVSDTPSNLSEAGIPVNGKAAARRRHWA